MSNKQPNPTAFITIRLVESTKSGGYKVWTTPGNEVYYMGAKGASEWGKPPENQPLEIQWFAGSEQFAGKKFISAWKPAQDAPNPVPQVKPIPPAPEPKKWPNPADSKPSGNGSKYTESDLKAFERKDRMMARECAYKCAAQDVTAYVEAGVSAGQFTGMSLNQIGDLLTARRNTAYTEILSGIVGDGLETSEIPW